MPVSQISPGMKLAEPITNTNGLTLMPAGIRLTPMFIARLQKWNIEAVDVLADKQEDARPAAGETTVAPKPRPRAEDGEYTITAEQEAFARTVAMEISRNFVNVRDNPLMVQLRASAIKRLILHGPDGIINVLRRPQVQMAEEGTV